MQAKFQHLEIARVNGAFQQARPVQGREGVVLGMAQDDAGHWSYVVDLGSTTWCFCEEELEPTGRHATPDDLRRAA